MGLSDSAHSSNRQFGSRWFGRRGTLAAASLALLGVAGGCGITEMDITLGEQKYSYDLMNNQTIPIPSVPCFFGCQKLLTMAGIIDNRVQAVCDADTNLCAADLNITIIYTLNVAEDPAFQLGIAQNTADDVRDVTLNYTITATTNFDITKIDVFDGPNGIMSKNDVGVEPIGSIGPIMAGGVLTQNQQPLVIQDGTPAHDQVVNNIKNPDIPFNFLMVSTVHLKSGDDLPKGVIAVSITPVVKILRR